MTDSDEPAFLDTNVLIYAVEHTEPKRTQAQRIIAAHTEIVISAQIIAEFVNTCLRKRVLTQSETRVAALYFMDSNTLVSNNEAVVRRGLAYHERYRLQWWDALVVAAAVEAGCATLYSEDMQDGQEIDGSTIVNPFPVAA